jgi:hypothetical protein
MDYRGIAAIRRLACLSIVALVNFNTFALSKFCPVHEKNSKGRQCPLKMRKIN